MHLSFISRQTRECPTFPSVRLKPSWRSRGHVRRVRCPTVTLMDRSEAHVGHAAVSDSDSQRTRALGGARKNVSKTGTHMRMHEGNSTTMTIQPIVIFGRRSNIMINKNHARFERSQICDRHETRLHGRRPQIATLGPSLMTACIPIINNNLDGSE